MRLRASCHSPRYATPSPRFDASDQLVDDDTVLRVHADQRAVLARLAERAEVRAFEGLSMMAATQRKRPQFLGALIETVSRLDATGQLDYFALTIMGLPVSPT